MKEQLISFETAKLAKEKGFDISVRNVFTIDYINDEIHNNEGDRNNWNSNSRDISRPTQSLLQKWLREIHNIHIKCEPTISNKYEAFICNLDWKYINIYNSYEEALEVGLFQALKLISC